MARILGSLADAGHEHSETASSSINAVAVSVGPACCHARCLPTIATAQFQMESCGRQYSGCNPRNMDMPKPSVRTALSQFDAPTAASQAYGQDRLFAIPQVDP